MRVQKKEAGSQVGGRDVVDIDADGIAPPSAPFLDPLSRDAFCLHRNHAALVQGVAGITSGRNAWAEEEFTHHVSEVLTRKEAGDTPEF